MIENKVNFTALGLQILIKKLESTDRDPDNNAWRNISARKKCEHRGAGVNRKGKRINLPNRSAKDILKFFKGK